VGKLAIQKTLPAMGQHNVYSWYIFQKSDAISTNKTNGDIVVLVL